jgi:hypothetical protein
MVNGVMEWRSWELGVGRLRSERSEVRGPAFAKAPAWQADQRPQVQGKQKAGRRVTKSETEKGKLRVERWKFNVER